MPVSARTKKKISAFVKTYRFGFRANTKEFFKTPKGLNEEVIRAISKEKDEPAWILQKRLAAYNIFFKKPLPEWGGDLSGIDFDNFYYYVKPTDSIKRRWQDVPKEIKETFEKIGIPHAERNYLAGVGSQYESEMVYHSLQEILQKQGVIFVSMDMAVKKYPELVRKYFGTLVPPEDNIFAALNTAVWSGGSFIYVPKNVHVALPLQAYFRINREFMGQFERTLIIADEGSSVHYVEGCSAPQYSTNSLHAAVVEIVVAARARVQYTTIQNWSSNVYNLVTKRAIAHEEAEMFWLDCNLGSRLTMKYPCIILHGRGARGEIQSLAVARKGQHQDAGAKVIHAAPETSSTIVSRSIAKDGGRASYRGLVRVKKSAKGVKTKVACDALILDSASRSDTYPTMIIDEQDASVAHEATVSKISDSALQYLFTRGFSETESSSLIVNGFAKPIVKRLPMEYAVEIQRLLELEMKGVG